MGDGRHPAITTWDEKNLVNNGGNLPINWCRISSINRMSFKKEYVAADPNLTWQKPQVGPFSCGTPAGYRSRVYRVIWGYSTYLYDMGVSINRDTQKWMVYNGKPY